MRFTNDLLVITDFIWATWRMTIFRIMRKYVWMRWTVIWVQILQYLILISYIHHLLMNKTFVLWFKVGWIRKLLTQFIKSDILFLLLRDYATILIRLKYSQKDVLILWVYSNTIYQLLLKIWKSNWNCHHKHITNNSRIGTCYN